MKVSHLRSIPLVQPPKCGKWRKISIFIQRFAINNFHVSKNRNLIKVLSKSFLNIIIFIHILYSRRLELLPVRFWSWRINEYFHYFRCSFIWVMNDSKKLISSINFVSSMVYSMINTRIWSILPIEKNFNLI